MLLGADGQPPTREASPRRSRWRLWLFLLVASVYLVTASGQIQTIDAQQELSVAASLRAGHGFATYMQVGRGGGAALGRDGTPYAAHDLGQTLLYLPLTWVPGTLRPVHGRACFNETSRHCWPTVAKVAPTARLEKLASLLPPLLGALLVLAFVELLVVLGFDVRPAVLTGLLMAFTSVVWVYSHISFDVTATALAITASLLGAASFGRSGSLRHLALGGAAMGAAIVVRSDAAPLALALGIVPGLAIWEQRRDLRRSLAIAASWGLPIVAALAVNGWYNWVRFGSATYNGNLHDPLLKATTPITLGLLGQTVSPGKGMLFYSPLLVVSLLGFPRLLRRHAGVGWAVVVAVVVQLAIHAPLADWSGDLAWAARHTIPITPLCFIPLAYVVDDLLRRPRSKLLLTVVAGLSAIGFVVQLGGVLADYMTIDIAKPAGTLTFNDTRRFQAVDGLHAIWRAIWHTSPQGAGRDGLFGTGPVPRFDVWWAREWAAGNTSTLISLVPVALLGLAVFAGVKLLRASACVRAPA